MNLLLDMTYVINCFTRPVSQQRF